MSSSQHHRLKSHRLKPHGFIPILEEIARYIDLFTEWTGRIIAWLTLAMMLITCIVVAMHAFFNSGSIALQETVSYLHALVFLLGAAFTLKRGGHVRVDILYQRFTPRIQALVDTLGTLLFLIPVCLLIFILSWDYVANSWEVREASKESQGLPWVYLLKTLLLVMPVTLLLQGIAETIKNGLFFFGLGTQYQADAIATSTADEQQKGMI